MPLIRMSMAVMALVLIPAVVFALPINQVVDPNTVSGAGLITFDDVPGGPAPGTNYDAIFESGGANFAERFFGQTRSTVGDHDVLSGSPTGPLALQIGAPGQNLNIFTDDTSHVLTGLGPSGFPNFDAVGEGSFAVLFDFDQSEFAFDLVGGNGGTATVLFFRRDGSLIDTIVLAGLGDQSYGFRREGSVRDIAGIAIFNDDGGGIGFDNLKHDVPGPAGLALVPIGDKTVDEGVVLTFQVNATGGGETKTFTAFELPRGATFEPTSRQFTWTPGSNQAGEYFPCFQVSDGESIDVECPTVTVNDTILDTDLDGVPDDVDNCKFVPNPDQSNLYGGLDGDVCDTQFVNTPVTTTSLNTSNVSVGQPIVMHACVTFTPTSPPSFVVRPDPFFVLLEVLDSAGHPVPPDGLPERRGLALPTDLVLITTTQTLCTDILVSELFFLPAGRFALDAKYVTIGVKDPLNVNGTCTDTGVGCYEPILQTIAPAGSQTITVRDTAGAQTGLDTLITAVGGLSDLGLGNSLRAKLQAARFSLLKGNIKAACGQLTAFTNEVSAQAGKKLTGDQAATFTSMANSVKTSLVCA